MARINAPLRRGWTTGACATAAVRAAYTALLTGTFPDPVSIVLPKGERPSFPLAKTSLDHTHAHAAIVKDAGDDPDVTHGASIEVTLSLGAPGSGVVFSAGEGVGTITKPGLPLEIGEPAINPMPRQMMEREIKSVAHSFGATTDVVIEICVPGGKRLAEKTWNPRLGILGGISILGTTGVVVPFSCSAWIYSIRQGIDVARAEGLSHVAGSTGAASEAGVKAHYGLNDTALIDMGDFAGGVLKYLRDHPVPRLTIAGGFAKISKLAAGFLDLHSGRSQVDFDLLADLLGGLGANEDLREKTRAANTAAEVLELSGPAGPALADAVAAKARETASYCLRGAAVTVDILIFDRQGNLVGRDG